MFVLSSIGSMNSWKGLRSFFYIYFDISIETNDWNVLITYVGRTLVWVARFNSKADASVNLKFDNAMYPIIVMLAVCYCDESMIADCGSKVVMFEAFKGRIRCVIASGNPAKSII